MDHTQSACDRTQSTCDRKCSRIGVPTSEEIRHCLGPSLAQIFFQYSHNDTKTLLDLIAPEKSPQPCFTVQIDDDKLTSLAHGETIKSNVHENILEIGGSILERFRKQIEEELRERINKQSEEKFYMYQAKKRLEFAQKSQELHEKYKKFIKTVQKEMQKQIECEWTKATAQWVKNLQKAVVQERIDVINEMMQKMRIEMAYVIQSLFEEFEESFRAQRENIIADFNGILRNKHVELSEEKREFEQKVGRELYIQRHQLEMESTVNVMCVHCVERLRCCEEKHIIHKYFQKRIIGLHRLIGRLNDIMNVMKEEIINCHIENNLLEEQFCEVTKQFQKFIDFVFRAAPGQAQYLLPLELQRLITVDNDKSENGDKEKDNK